MPVYETTQLDEKIVVAALELYVQFWNKRAEGKLGKQLAEAAQAQLDLVSDWPTILRVDGES